MRKLLFLILFCTISTCACTNSKLIGMPNPWQDCGTDLACAKKIAGFNFPIENKNAQIRAMKDMIEITFPLDQSHDLIIRKSSKEINSGDLSGDYNSYPINKKVTLDNGVIINIRGDKDLVYVMYFAAEQGYYSVSCLKGITMVEVKFAYEILAEAEAPKFLDGNTH